MHYTPLRCQYYILVDVEEHTRKPESSRSHPLTSMKQMAQSRNHSFISSPSKHFHDKKLQTGSDYSVVQNDPINYLISECHCGTGCMFG